MCLCCVRLRALGLLARSSLSDAEFLSGGFAGVLRACQAAGDCSQFEWESVRQLILLRLQNVRRAAHTRSGVCASGQCLLCIFSSVCLCLCVVRTQVYESYLTSDRSAANGSSEESWMCAECRKSVMDAAAGGAEAKAAAIANAHCRRSEAEEEPPHVTISRIRQGILQFYKSHNTRTARASRSSLRSLLLTRCRCRRCRVQASVHCAAHVRSATRAAPLLQDHQQIPARLCEGQHSTQARSSPSVLGSMHSLSRLASPRVCAACPCSWCAAFSAMCLRTASTSTGTSKRSDAHARARLHTPLCLVC